MLSTDPLSPPQTESATAPDAAPPGTPAARVVKALGGVKAAADASGRSVKSVYRWLAPAAKGGTGGAVPRGAQRAIVTNAPAVSFADFLPRDGEAFL